MAFPFTVSSWGRPGEVGSNAQIMGNLNAAGDQTELQFKPSGSSGYQTRNGGNSGSIGTAAVVTINTWNHFAATVTSANLRAVFLNGANKTGNVGNVPTPPATNTFGIGGNPANVTQFPWIGPIGHVAMWSVVLTDDEIFTLGQGVSPLRVRRDALIRYWPMNRLTGGEVDVVGGFAVPEVNGPIAAADEPIPTAGVPFAFAGRFVAP
jgi:hypothetical protein